MSLYSESAQTAAALVIFNGYRIAPFVVSFPDDYHQVTPRESEPFLRLVRYMARYKELAQGPETWAPFDVFHGEHGLRGVAVAPWLRGGANYLLSILGPAKYEFDAPECVPIQAWFRNIETLADACRRFHTRDAFDVLMNVASQWGVKDGNRADYYAQVQEAADLLGFETDTQRLVHLRRKKALHSA